MVRLLVKKQFRELFGNLYKKADGSRRSKGAVILYAAAFVFLFLIFAGMFAAMCASVCDIFHEAGLDWAYFGLAYLVALVIYQVGSLFTGNVNVLGLIVAIAVIVLFFYMLFRPYKEATRLTVKVKTAK